MLHLDADEKTALYNATGKQKNSIPPDSHDYIIWHEYVNAALRISRDIDASEKNGSKRDRFYQYYLLYYSILFKMIKLQSTYNNCNYRSNIANDNRTKNVHIIIYRIIILL